MSAVRNALDRHALITNVILSSTGTQIHLSSHVTITRSRTVLQRMLLSNLLGAWKHFLWSSDTLIHIPWIPLLFYLD